jgi:hypothetical protein
MTWRGSVDGKVSGPPWTWAGLVPGDSLESDSAGTAEAKMNGDVGYPLPLEAL